MSTAADQTGLDLSIWILGCFTTLQIGGSYEQNAKHSPQQHPRSSTGQGMTEYIIITALIAIAAIGAVMYFGRTARSQIGGMAEELSGQSATSDIQANGAGHHAI